MTTPVHIPAPRRSHHRLEPAVDEPETAPGQDERDRLVVSHMAVARSIASRYRNRGVADDDLDAVAYLALVKAASRYDPAAGTFLAFAVPTVRGEIRRHFRDVGWVIRPPRRLQELQMRVREATSRLSQELGHPPAPAEIAADLGLDESLLTEAFTMDGCFAPASLARPVGEGDNTLGDLIEGDPSDWAVAEARMALAPALRVLGDRDRLILTMRHFDDSTQQEIATAIGVNQSQVSRLLDRIYADLRSALGEPDGR